MKRNYFKKTYYFCKKGKAKDNNCNCHAKIYIDENKNLYYNDK